MEKDRPPEEHQAADSCCGSSVARSGKDSLVRNKPKTVVLGRERTSSVQNYTLQAFSLAKT
jgi:hypothetical protein